YERHARPAQTKNWPGTSGMRKREYQYWGDRNRSRPKAIVPGSQPMVYAANSTIDQMLSPANKGMTHAAPVAPASPWNTAIHTAIRWWKAESTSSLSRLLNTMLPISRTYGGEPRSATALGNKARLRSGDSFPTVGS